MFYAIRHLTRYRYSRPVWQSMMEVRMHPLSEGSQRCFTFRCRSIPAAHFSHSDALGNPVHHFDLPHRHRELTIIADALVNIDAPQTMPEPGLRAWDELIGWSEGDHWQMLMPSHYARPSPALHELARSSGA